MTTTMGPRIEDNRAMTQVSWLGMVINIVLATVKFLAGIFSHSQVLIADAVHSLSDLSTDLAILIGIRYWEQPADADHPHGHAKIETLVTLFIGIVLFLVGLGLINSAISSLNDLMHGVRRPLPGLFALSAAIFSIVIKEILYQVTASVGRRFKSSAVIANAWHHRSDAISSIPAALAVFFCLCFGDQYVFLDPVGTLLVSCMILYTSIQIMRPTLGTLADHGLSPQKIHKIEECVSQHSIIHNVHKIRTRPLGEQKYAVDLHIKVDPEMTVREAHALSHHLERDLCRDEEEIVEVVVHIEPWDGFDSADER